jgi:hypothetical protein
MSTSGSGRVWLGTEGAAYGAGVNDERGRLQGRLAEVTARHEKADARIAELERLLDDILPMFAGTLASDLMRSMVPAGLLARWHQIRHSGEEAVAAADEVSRLGEEIQGGGLVTSIRTMHPYGYRSGEWATLAGQVQVKGRDCYVVRFDDGASDFWVIGDPDGQYEFSEACPDQGGKP